MDKKKFLIECRENGRFLYDFAFAVEQAVNFENWYRDLRGDDRYEVVISKDISEKDCIPIGSLTFVMNYYQKHFGIKNITVINIPKELQEERYLKRKIYLQDDIDFLRDDESYFIKDISRYKGYTDVVKGEEIKRLHKKGLHIFSEEVDFLAEFRCFVFNKRIIDIRRYLGDFYENVDKKMLEEMISRYSDISSYTLDVGIIEKDGKKHTVLIEIHPFFSCSFYGFSDYSKIIQMAVQMDKEIIKKRGKI